MRPRQPRTGGLSFAAALPRTSSTRGSSRRLRRLWATFGRASGRGRRRRGWRPRPRAEVLLQCGTLTGWLGSARHIAGAQEEAKDLLFEALATFRSQGMASKASEAQYELGICYWRLGAFDEARLMMNEAMKPLHRRRRGVEGRKSSSGRTLVDVSENKYYEALDLLKEAEPLFGIGRRRAQGQVARAEGADSSGMLGTAERRAEYFDSAIMEYTAAIFHYEQANHERYCALNLNNLALPALQTRALPRRARAARPRAAHLHASSKTRAISRRWTRRARGVLVAEKKFREADRVMAGVVKTLEQGGEAALLADALTVARDDLGEARERRRLDHHPAARDARGARGRGQLARPGRPR